MAASSNSLILQALLGNLAIKRNVFISYHHDGDQWYYNTFSGAFGTLYGCIQDNSLDRLCDSDNCDYVMQRIRDKYITGTSATVVLCGAATPWRKYVDWEIKATLDKEHGLLGVMLPTCQRDANNNYIVPDRLHDNIQSGYAAWATWGQLTGPDQLKALIEVAISRSSLSLLINNSRSMRGRNG